jgi:hypothetical protein
VSGVHERPALGAVRDIQQRISLAHPLWIDPGADCQVNERILSRGPPKEIRSLFYRELTLAAQNPYLEEGKQFSTMVGMDQISPGKENPLIRFHPAPPDVEHGNRHPIEG